jgi:predicted amidohydrolase
MKIAICQTEGNPGQVGKNLDRMKQSAATAARTGADLLIFPETYLSGYNIGADIEKVAEKPDGPASRVAAAIARESNIALLYGYPEKAPDGIYNSALLIDRNGETRINCRKTHLYGSTEKQRYRLGDSLVHTELDGLSIGVLICYDVEFPEAVRSLTLAGADLIAVPTALMKPFCRIIDIVIAARAYENQVYVAYANRCGREGDLVYCGRSTVVGPDGNIIAQAGTGAEILYAEIDRKAISAERRDNPVLADRRSELYGSVMKR